MLRLFPNIRLAPDSVSVNGSSAPAVVETDDDADGPGELAQDVTPGSASVDGTSKNAKGKPPATAPVDQNPGDHIEDDEQDDDQDTGAGEPTDGSGRRGKAAADTGGDELGAEERADLVLTLGKDRVEKLLKHGPAGIELAREEAKSFDEGFIAERAKSRAKAAAQDDTLETPRVLPGQETAIEDDEQADQAEQDDKPAVLAKPKLEKKTTPAVKKATEDIFKSIPPDAVSDYDLANGEGAFAKTFSPIVARLAETEQSAKAMLKRVEDLAEQLGGTQIEAFLDSIGDDSLGRSRFELDPPHVERRRKVVTAAMEAMQYAKQTKRPMNLTQAMKLGWRTVKREEAEAAAAAQRKQATERRARSVSRVPSQSDGGAGPAPKRSNAAAAAFADSWYAKH